MMPAPLITVGPGFQEYAERVAGDGAERAKALILARLTVILNDAVARWPVGRTGQSAMAWRLTVDGNDVRIRFELRNDSGYAPFINRGRALHELVVIPFRDAVARLPGEIDRILAEVANG